MNRHRMPAIQIRANRFSFREGEIGNFTWEPGKMFYFCVGLLGFAVRVWRQDKKWNATTFRYIPSWRADG